MSKLENLKMTSTKQKEKKPSESPVEEDPETKPKLGKSKNRSKISLLTSSYPIVHSRMYRQASEENEGASRTVRGINLEPPRQQKPITIVKRKPQRYHFGIRSRGQGALEVLHEIYKSLEKLGAEWMVKQPNPESKNKSPLTLPIDPFTIKCRWRKTYPRKSIRNNEVVLESDDDMYVYMEIQLYQQPEPRDYLVDFKWGGYELVGASSNEQINHDDDDLNGELPGEDAVHSCFPFLDLASTLINALARGSD
jgi:hypothetical protein